MVKKNQTPVQKTNTDEALLFKRIKYPKLLMFTLSIIFAYILFAQGQAISINGISLKQLLVSWGYFGTFLAGILYAYGFTSTIGTAILLIISQEQNIVYAGLIAGLGALIGDLIIFRYIRSSFKQEIKKLSQEPILKLIQKNISYKLQKYLFAILAIIIIASPLPDEIGVSLIAGATTISTRLFIIGSYVLNTTGIFVVLLIGVVL